MFIFFSLHNVSYSIVLFCNMLTIRYFACTKHVAVFHSPGMSPATPKDCD